MGSHVMIAAAAAVAVCALWATSSRAEPAPAADAWDTPLAEDYAPWCPVTEALTALAHRGGATDVRFDGGAPEGEFTVPVPAGLSVREALEAAAGVCGLEPVIDGQAVTFRKAARRRDWVDLIGGKTVRVDVDGGRGMLYLPKRRKGDGPVPWVWYAPHGLGPFLAWHMKHLFDAGVAVAVVNIGESHGSPQGRAIYQAFYEKLIAEHGLGGRPVLLPQSRGGLMLYNWAAEHADRVRAIGGIYTVCDLRSYPGLEKAAEVYGMTPEALQAHLAEHNPVDRLAPLAKAGVPIFHIHGDSDRVVALEKNAGELVRRYRALGGQAELVTVPGKGHAVLPEFFHSAKLSMFLVEHSK